LLEEQVEERGAVGKDETKRVKTVTQAAKPSQHTHTPTPTPLPATSLTAAAVRDVAGTAAVREVAGSGVGVAGCGVEAFLIASSSSLKSTQAVERGAATHTQTRHGTPIKKEGLHQSSKSSKSGPHFRRRESWTATSWCSVWRAQQDVERGETERGPRLQDCEIEGLVADCITQIVLTVSSHVSLAASR
jgi:hypothetical protein